MASLSTKPNRARARPNSPTQPETDLAPLSTPEFPDRRGQGYSVWLRGFLVDQPLKG